MKSCITSESAVRRRLLRAGIWMCVFPLTVATLWVLFWRHHLKRFEPVEPGVLYRVAQPTEFGFRHAMRRHHIRTNVSVRLEDPPLYTGWLDLGEPDGRVESTYVPTTGLVHRHWPLGEEAYWPWFTPWFFEEFFRLMDDPDNLPVLVHCLGGRHRTGTFVALYELEYSRRDVPDVLQEMYSHKFGPPALVQEHNLRTYRPRPIPSAAQWEALRTGLFPASAVDSLPTDYAALVRLIKRTPADDALWSRIEQYIADETPFALCLAERVIDSPQHRLADCAARIAHACLQGHSDPQTLASAAALVADLGDVDQQQSLLDALRQEQQSATPSARYSALVTGVTNRYTPNRIVYVAALLEDRRQRIEPHAGMYRYCDTGMARLTSIVNKVFHTLYPGREGWDKAVASSRQWLEAHPQDVRLSKLLPPGGRNKVRIGTRPEIDGQNTLQ